MNNEPSIDELAYPLRNAHRTAKVMKGLDELLSKYEDIQEHMCVMDDYDGGQMHMVNLIVTDLKNLKKPLDNSEKTGTL